MTRTPHLITKAVAVGVAELVVRPASWPRWVRRAYIVMCGAVITAATATALGPRHPAEGPGPSDTERPEEDPRHPGALVWAQAVPCPTRWALCAGAGLLTSAVQAGGLALDGGLERWLTRCGLMHPRRVMAALAAATQLAVDLLPSTVARAGREPRTGVTAGHGR